MVMSTLLKKSWRDLIEARGQFISLIIIVSLGVAFYTGINATLLNLSNASETYFNEFNMADYWIDLENVPISKLKQIEGIPGVKMAEGRIIENLSAFKDGENVTLRVISGAVGKDKNEISRYWLRSGRSYRPDQGECVVEENYFKANGYRLGDTLQAYWKGKAITLKIVGTARSPEYIYALKDGSELMPDPVHFGILFIGSTYAESVFAMAQSANSLSLKCDENTNYDQLKILLEKKLDAYGVYGQYPRKNQLSYAMLHEEMKGLKSVSGSFPLVFMLVAAIIIYLMMGRMVEHQRTQIGVLKAFGFSNRKVLWHFVSYGILVSVLGSILGAVLGLFLGNWMTELENSYFHLPLKTNRIYPELLLPAVLLTSTFCLIASYEACKKAFRLSPSEAMRPKVPPSGKAIALEKFKKFWNRQSFIWKMIYRNMFRHKRRNFMTACGVMFGTALLLVTFGMNDTVNLLVMSQYETIQNYDLKITTSTFIPKSDWHTIEGLKHVTRMEPLLEIGVEMKNGSHMKTVGLTAITEDAILYRLSDKNGKVIPLTKMGIMMPKKLADQLHIAPHDTIKVKPLITGKKAMNLVYSKEIYQYIGINGFCSFEQAEAFLKEGKIANAFVLRLDDPRNADQVKSVLKDYKNVSSVVTKTDSLENLEANMKLMTASLGVMVLLAGVLSIAVIYNVATISIFERQRELASLKVLGLRDRELEKIIFYENYLLAAIAAIMGLPLGYGIGQLMSLSFQSDSYSFQFVMGTYSYIYAVVLSLVFAWVSNQWLKKKIKKLDMIAVLKSIE